MTLNSDFQSYIKRWHLVQDGEPVVTQSSLLLPVVADGAKAMLKIARSNEEKMGAGLMVWWDGQGAARVIRYDSEAILMERVTGLQFLASMVRNDDGCASTIICNVVAELHKTRQKPLPELVPLSSWFSALLSSSKTGVLARSAATAQLLLANPSDMIPLHGDIHHANILDFGERGWLAIDPKGLLGERGFDYANLFCNPDHSIALAPNRLLWQVDLVAQQANLERYRLLQWILAWTGLSAIWFEEDGEDACAISALQIAQLAAAELDKK